MIRKNMFLTLSFLALYQSPINAVCSEVVIANKGDNTILFVNDRHVDQVGNKKGLIQRKHILEHLSWVNGNARTIEDRPFLIVEDMLHCENQAEKVQQCVAHESLSTSKNNDAELQKTIISDQECSIEDTISVLGNLIVDSKQADLDCYNAECRQVKWVSRSEDFVNGHEVTESFEENVAEIMQELEAIKNDANNNGQAQIIYDVCMRIMNQNERTSQSTIEYLRNCFVSLKQLEDENSVEFAQNYNRFHDQHLIDVRILISWYKNRSRKMISIIAGEFHLENAIPVFKKLGFDISRHGEKYSKDQQGMIATVQNSLNFEEFFKDATFAQPLQPSFLQVVDNDLLQSSELLFENIIAANINTITLL